MSDVDFNVVVEEVEVSRVTETVVFENEAVTVQFDLTENEPVQVEVVVEEITFDVDTVTQPSSVEFWRDRFVLNSTQVTNTSVFLTHTPVEMNSLQLTVRGAPGQTWTDDYTVTGSTLSWAGLALDGVLGIGDVIEVVYRI